MSWLALFLILFLITAIVGALILFSKYIVKCYPRSELARELGVLEILCLVLNLVLVLMPLILPKLNTIFSFLNPVAHGLGFIIYGVCVSLISTFLLYQMQQKGWLPSLTHHSSGTPNGAP
ncbi:MAG: hypothetical protein HOP06_04775 [Methylotenera sp.]|nr:hypothetical protein [Methylotenera sp.]